MQEIIVPSGSSIEVITPSDPPTKIKILSDSSMKVTIMPYPSTDDEDTQITNFESRISTKDGNNINKKQPDKVRNAIYKIGDYIGQIVVNVISNVISSIIK